MSEKRCIIFVFMLLGLSIIPNFFPPEEGVINMTDHEQQIYNIINIITGYSGSYYPNRRDLNTPTADNPDFIVWAAEPIAQTNTMYAEKFKVYFKATTRTELQTIKAAMLELSSGAVSGYNAQTVSNTVELEDADEDARFCESDYPRTIPIVPSWQTNDGGMDVGYLAGPEQHNSYPVVKFPYEINPDVTYAVYLNWTLDSSAELGGGQIYGVEADSIGTLTDITSITPTTAYGTWNTPPTETRINTNITTVVAELITRTGFTNENLAFIFIETAEAGDGVIYGAQTTIDANSPDLTITYTIPSTYPFWIEVSGGNPNFNENEFEVEFEIEARWTL